MATSNQASGGDQFWMTVSGASSGSGANPTFTPTTGNLTGTWTTQTISSFPMEARCIVCDLALQELNDSGVGLCELCRQAILKFREMVLAEMARDLMKMIGEAEDAA